MFIIYGKKEKDNISIKERKEIKGLIATLEKTLGGERNEQ